MGILTRRGTVRKVHPKSPKLTRFCELCGSLFLIKPYEVRRGNGRFCSQLCCNRSRVIPVLQRFWAKVDKSGGQDACWLWLAGKDSSGYGTFEDKYKSYSAHRFTWELHNGPVPAGMEVCHHCDNPACVNPAHLWLGTHADNMRDCSAKGRMWPGKRTVNAKLTIEQVQAIRHQCASHGMTQKQLAKEYGVCLATIGNIASRRTWWWLANEA